MKKKRLIKRSEAGDNTKEYLYPNGSSIVYDPESRTFTINQGGLGRTLYVNTDILGNYGTKPAEVNFNQSRPSMTYEEAEEFQKRARAMGYKGIRAYLPEIEIVGNQITPQLVDQAYAEQFFPATVSHPEKAHDPNVTELFYKEHPEALTMTQKDYEEEEKKLKDRENELVGAATLAIGSPAIGRGVKAAGKAIGESIVNPGGLVDRIALKVAPQIIKYNTPILGATTAPGMATNALVTSAFAGDAARNIINGNLNWETGLETAFAAMPFVGEGVRQIPMLYERLPYNVKHPIKWANKKLNLKSRIYEFEGLELEYNLENESKLNKELDALRNEYQNKFRELTEERYKLYTKKNYKFNSSRDYYRNKRDKLTKELNEKLNDIALKYGIAVDDLKYHLLSAITDIRSKNSYLIAHDIDELTLKAIEYKLIHPGDKIFVSDRGNFFIRTQPGETMSFNTISGENIPILDQNGKIVGTHQVEIRAENGSFTPSEEYRKVTANNIKALETKFPGSKAFGSSVGVSELGIPHYTHDIDLLITEEDAAKIPGLSEMRFNGNGYTKTVGIDKDGNIVSTHSPESVYEVDFNIIAQDANGKAIGPLAEEIYRQFYPQEASESFHNQFIIDSNRLQIDIPHTPKELLDSVDPAVKTILDSYEIDIGDTNKSKHVSRILNYLRTSLDQDKVSQAINLLSMLIDPTGLWRPPRFAFDNPKENAEILKEMGLAVDDATTHNPKVMLNLFDFWILDHLTTRRGIYNNPVRTKINFNKESIPIEERKKISTLAFLENKSIGGRAYTQGLNTVQGGTSGIVGKGTGGNGGSFDIIGAQTVKVNWSGVTTPHEAIQKAYYATGSPEYEGKWPDIFLGMTPIDWGMKYNNLTDEQWSKKSGELRKLGINAITDKYERNYQRTAGRYRTLMNYGGTNPVYNFLRNYLYPLRNRLNIHKKPLHDNFFGEFYHSKKQEASPPIISPLILGNGLIGGISYNPYQSIIISAELLPYLKELSKDRHLLTELITKINEINSDYLISGSKFPYRLQRDKKYQKLIDNIDDEITDRRQTFYEQSHLTTKKYGLQFENSLKRASEMRAKLNKTRYNRDKVKTASLAVLATSAFIGGIAALKKYADNNVLSRIMTEDKVYLRDKDYWLDSGRFEKYLNDLEKKNLTTDERYALNIKRKQLEYYKQTGEWKPVSDFIEVKRKGGKLIPRKFKSLKKPD